MIHGLLMRSSVTRACIHTHAYINLSINENRKSNRRMPTANTFRVSPHNILHHTRWSITVGHDVPVHCMWGAVVIVPCALVIMLYCGTLSVVDVSLHCCHQYKFLVISVFLILIITENVRKYVHSRCDLSKIDQLICKFYKGLAKVTAIDGAANTDWCPHQNNLYLFWAV